MSDFSHYSRPNRCCQRKNQIKYSHEISKNYEHVMITLLSALFATWCVESGAKTNFRKMWRTISLITVTQRKRKTKIRDSHNSKKQDSSNCNITLTKYIILITRPLECEMKKSKIIILMKVIIIVVLLLYQGSLNPNILQLLTPLLLQKVLFSVIHIKRMKLKKNQSSQ